MAISKEDRKAIAKFKSSALKARQESGRLLVKFAGYLPDGNIEPLNELLRAIIFVRAYDADAFVKFVLFHTGGHTSADNGDAEYVPEKSALQFNADDSTFSIKKVQVTREERERLTEEEVAETREARRINQICALHHAAGRMGKGAWWEFSAARPKNPYSFKAVLSALKKASKEYEQLSADERKVLDAMINAAEAAGMRLD